MNSPEIQSKNRQSLPTEVGGGSAGKVVPLFAESKRHACRLLQEFIVESGEKLRRYLIRRVSSVHEAEDIAQEAYCRLLEHPDPQRIEYPRSFVFRVAVNLLIDQRRKKSRSPVTDEQLVDDELDGSTALNFNELSVAYRNALEELSPVCQRVFVLCRHQGLTTGDIAVRLNISQRMVQKHLVKALQHFEKQLR